MIDCTNDLSVAPSGNNGLKNLTNNGTAVGTVYVEPAAAGFPLTIQPGETVQATVPLGVCLTMSCGDDVVVENESPRKIVGFEIEDQNNMDGQAGTIPTASAFEDIDGTIVSYQASGLPPGAAFDTATGLITYTLTSADSANSPYQITLTATDDDGATSGPCLFDWYITPLQAETKCGCLPPVELLQVFREGTDPQTNIDGDTYNIDGVYEYLTPGGVALATVDVLSTVDDPSTLRPQGTTTGPDAIVNSGLSRVFAIDNMSPWSGTASAFVTKNWQFQLLAEPTAAGLSVLGDCDPAKISAVFSAEDVDNGSIISGLSRPWDDEEQNDPATGAGYTESPPGTFDFDTQANYYLYWNETAIGAGASVSLNYEQGRGDGVGLGAQLSAEIPVLYQCDPTGNIIAAETIDGPLDPARWPDIIPKIEIDCPNDEVLEVAPVAKVATGNLVSIVWTTTTTTTGRVCYWPTNDPSDIRYSPCWWTTTDYGDAASPHQQNFSVADANTEFTYVVQYSATGGTSAADCDSLPWENISCPDTFETGELIAGQSLILSDFPASRGNFENFETGNFVAPPPNWPATDEQVRLNILNGSHYGGGAKYLVDPSIKEVWFRYWVQVAPNWSTAVIDGVKAMGLSSHQNGGWTGAAGGNGGGYAGLCKAFSFRLMFGPTGWIRIYAYHLDNTSGGSDSLHPCLPGNNNPPASGDRRYGNMIGNTTPVLNDGQPHCVEGRVKLNTLQSGQYTNFAAAARDGEAELRIDGVTTGIRNNLHMTNNPAYHNLALWLNAYHGGSPVAAADTWILYDCIEVSDSGWLGC